MNDFLEEKEFWRQVMAAKFLINELDIYALDRITRRIADLSYQAGRKDEKYYREDFK